jgi:hypothetical protein
LLIGTRATDAGSRENHGKPACLPEKMGTKKKSYASAIIGVHGPGFGYRVAEISRTLPEPDLMIKVRRGTRFQSRH